MQVLTVLARSMQGLKELAHLVQVQSVLVLKDQEQSDCDHQQLVQESITRGLKVREPIAQELRVQALIILESNVYDQH